MAKYLWFVLLVGLMTGVRGQVFNDENQRDSLKQVAAEHARTLKDGKLVIRFRSHTQQKEKLAGTGNERKLEKFELENHRFRTDILSAFQLFDYADVYYTFSDNFRNMLETGRGEIILLNGSDTTLIENLDGVYFLDPYEVRAESMDKVMVGFTVMDHRGNALQRPFPYYILKRQGSLLFRKTYPQMVLELQTKLQQLHQKAD